MFRHVYTIVVGFFVGVAVIFGRESDPFGRNFVSIVVPCLLCLGSLQWFVPPAKLRWRILGSSVSLVSALALLFFYSSSGRLSFADFATMLILGMFGQLVLLRLLDKDPVARSVTLAITLGITFVIVLGLYVIAARVELPFSSSGRFLLWSPLAAMALWVSSVTTKWTKITRLIFIIMVVQMAMGLLDAGAGQNIQWLIVLAFVLGLAALGITAWWAKSLERP